MSVTALRGETPLPTLRLSAFSLFSKWGFSDGEVLGDWLRDAEDATGRDLRAEWKTDQHKALRELVKQHLLPLIPGPFTTRDIETSHNPIRVEVWRGKEWDDYADNEPPEVEGIGVTVPGDLVLAALRRLM